MTEAHAPVLRALVERGFAPTAFALFPGYLGLRRDDCGALLEALPGGKLRLAAQPCFLVAGNLSARVEQGGEEWFVWKQQRVRATAERRQALQRVEEDL
ncbi:MAG: hypothetical protein ACE5HB_03855, partial [Terriglobia bacterium]